MPNNPTREQADELAKPVVTHLEKMIVDAIDEGPGHPFWEAVKQMRTEFGVNGVLAPIVMFNSADEYQLFLDEGKLPNFQENKAFGASYIDETCVDKHLQLMGVTDPVPAVQAHVENMIEWAEQPWEMPLLSTIVFAYDTETVEEIPTVFRGGCVDWYDNEKDTVPYPNVTHDKIRSYLRDNYPDWAVSRRILTLDTRHPHQAGPNLDIWLDICEELQIMPMVSAESADVLEHLSDENKSKVLAIPFLNAAPKS